MRVRKILVDMVTFDTYYTIRGVIVNEFLDRIGSKGNHAIPLLKSRFSEQWFDETETGMGRLKEFLASAQYWGSEATARLLVESPEFQEKAIGIAFYDVAAAKLVPFSIRSVQKAPQCFVVMAEINRAHWQLVTFWDGSQYSRTVRPESLPLVLQQWVQRDCGGNGATTPFVREAGFPIADTITFVPAPSPLPLKSDYLYCMGGTPSTTTRRIAISLLQAMRPYQDKILTHTTIRQLWRVPPRAAEFAPLTPEVLKPDLFLVRISPDGNEPYRTFAEWMVEATALVARMFGWHLRDMMQDRNVQIHRHTHMPDLLFRMMDNLFALFRFETSNNSQYLSHALSSLYTCLEAHCLPLSPEQKTLLPDMKEGRLPTCQLKPIEMEPAAIDCIDHDQYFTGSEHLAYLNFFLGTGRLYGYHLNRGPVTGAQKWTWKQIVSMDSATEEQKARVAANSVAREVRNSLS